MISKFPSEIPYFDTRSEDEPYLQNYEALAALKKEIRNITIAYGGIVVGVGTAGCLFPTLGIVALTSASASGMMLSAEYGLRLANLHDITKMLLDAYGRDGIVVTPRIKTETATIDLFVRMPDKRAFALAIRGGTREQSISWREDIQQFRSHRKGKAQKCGQLDKALEALSTTVDLKKNKHPIMGVSSAERKVNIIKTLVLPQYSRISDSNPSDALVSFGNAQRVLKIVTSSTAYVVESKDLIDFLANPKK